MKMAALLRVLFLPRDFDKDEHSTQIRPIKEAHVSRVQASRDLRRTLARLDLAPLVDDVQSAMVKSRDEPGRR